MILECKNLAIGYDNRIVMRNPNFTIEEGEYVCLFGDNGSGKSTLVKTILGLIPKSRGEINFTKDLSQKSKLMMLKLKQNMFCFLLQKLGLLEQQ